VDSHQQVDMAAAAGSVNNQQQSPYSIDDELGKLARLREQRSISEKLMQNTIKVILVVLIIVLILPQTEVPLTILLMELMQVLLVMGIWLVLVVMMIIAGVVWLVEMPLELV
jgi:hypothetical protein